MARRNMSKALLIIQNLESEELVSQLLDQFTKNELIFLCKKLKVASSNKNMKQLKESILNNTVRLYAYKQAQRESAATVMEEEVETQQQHTQQETKEEEEEPIEHQEYSDSPEANLRPSLTGQPNRVELNFNLLTNEDFEVMLRTGEDERSDYAFSYLSQYIEYICINHQLDFIDEYIITCMLVDAVNHRFGKETVIIGKEVSSLGDFAVDHEFLLRELRPIIATFVEEFIFIVVKLELTEPYIFRTLRKLHNSMLRDTLVKNNILKFYAKKFS